MGHYFDSIFEHKSDISRVLNIHHNVMSKNKNSVTQSPGRVFYGVWNVPLMKPHVSPGAALLMLHEHEQGRSLKSFKTNWRISK